MPDSNAIAQMVHLSFAQKWVVNAVFLTSQIDI